MTLLFVIRASTVGGMVSDEDIWLDASGHLCMIIRFVKCWVTRQQKSTGKKLPIKQVGRDNIPFGGRGLKGGTPAVQSICHNNGGKKTGGNLLAARQ
jgi:hypothetical protein